MSSALRLVVAQNAANVTWDTQQARPCRSAAMIVVPEPTKGSYTVSANGVSEHCPGRQRILPDMRARCPKVTDHQYGGNWYD